MSDIKKLKTALRIGKEQIDLIENLEKIKSTSDMPIVDSLRYVSHFFGASTVILGVKENGNIGFYSNLNKRMPDINLLSRIAGDVISEVHPVIINNTRKHEGLRENDIRNLLAVPIVAKEKILGVVMVINKRFPFKTLSLKFAETIAKSFASLVKQTALLDELNTKRKELGIIRDIDKIRDTIKDFDLMIKSVLNETVKFIDAEVAFFILHDGEKVSMQFAGKSEHSGIIKKNKKVITEFAEESLEKGELIHKRELSPELNNGIAVPIILEEDKQGIIGVLNSREQQFTRYDKDIMLLISAQIDSAIFEDFEKKQIKNIFKRYVAEEVMEEMLKNPDAYLKTIKQEITVLFSDLRGFTSMSEKLKAEDVVDILNEHFEVMTEIILKHKGTLDKFVGDEIMAVFGAPIYYEGHALRAVKVALEMQEAQKKLTRKWKKKYNVDVEIGIGINTGEAIIGNIGSKDRMDYTAIGDTVNVGARLCSKADGGQTIISSRAYEEVRKSVRVNKLEALELKGKAKPQQVYEVAGLR